MYPVVNPPWAVNSALDSADDEVLGKVYDWRVVRRLPKYLATVRLWIVLGAAGMVLRSLASLALPYLVATAVDRFIRTGSVSGLNTIALLFVGATVLVWAGQYLETLFLNYTGDAILRRLRSEMFDHLQLLSLSFFDRNKAGKIMSRLQNDVQQLQDLLTGGFLNIAVSALTLVGIATVMLIMNTRLALVTLTVVPVLGVVIFVWQRHAHHAFVRVRQAIATVNAQLQESISGVRVTQSLGREKTNLKQFDIINEAHLVANLKASRLTAVMMPIVEILTAIATALVIVFGGYQVIAGQMGVGVLLGFVLYIQRFFNPVQELAMEYTELQRAMVAGERIFELLDTKPEIMDSPEAIDLPPVKGEIKLQHVSFSYHTGSEVLHDIDLTIHPGETVAIVGRTGAGKSSLANLIARFYDIERGVITIDGYDVRRVTQHSLRRQIGIVPQDPFLFSGSIEENIRYGHLEASRAEVIGAAKAAGAHDFIARLERGDETPVGERGVNLSTGQRQLICLARAILANPPILILDEATSSVDTNTERLIQESLRHLSRGRTSIIIAHRLSTVTDADRIIVLERGNIAEVGSHRELMAKEGLYYQMFRALTTPDAELSGVEPEEV
ncbi:MAG: transporter ATP-binding protein [Dehalococcoidales bacterium]|nr:transporter ATP-binding protein [Dehalococcoidales bacterium]